MKRLTSIFIVLAMLLTLAPMNIMAANDNASVFSDVKDTDYYAQAAEALAQLDVLAGYPDGTFGAEKSITRAEMAAIVCRMIDKESDAEEEKGKTDFDDVSNDHWASGYINIASKEGIINGDGNGKFRPEDDVKHEEAIKMVVCALGYGDDVEVDAKDWSKGYLEVADEKGISADLKGTKGKASTRGDVAVMSFNGLKVDLATPTTSLKAGSYRGTKTVKLETTTEGAEIYYTTDGSTPTSKSTKYTKALSLSKTCTLKAIAVKDGVLVSDVLSVDYTIRRSSGGSSKPSTYTVSFDLNYDGATETPKTQSVVSGKNAICPDMPTRQGFSFAGWYLDKNESDLTNQFDFDVSISSNVVLYAIWIDIDEDADLDGIPNQLESFFGSDVNKADTDNDGLNDYIECIILGTNPTLIDSDNNNINDFDEDADNDELANGLEISYGTDLISPDTDFDGLTDGEEINGVLYATNPLEEDTDIDGANDFWEIENNFNPIVYNNSFDVIVTANSTNLSATATTTINGEKANSLSVTPLAEHPLLTSDMPGYIDVPFEFTIDDNLEGETAVISFAVSSNIERSTNFTPTIYYFDDETQNLIELETQFDGSVASTTVNHFSTYILLNKTEFDVVWEEEIKPPLSNGESEDEATLDIAFVIDYSASMDWNDPQKLFKKVSKEFVEKLRNDKDKAAVVKFIKRATVVSGLTSNKEALNSAIDSISYDSGYGTYSGTDGSAGYKAALDELLESDSEYRYIILITDGEDNGYSYDYDDLIATSTSNNIIVYTIGMGSASESTLKKIANSTGGKYYHATTDVSSDELINLDDVFEDIESETIDLETDTDLDKIPDYYETRLKNGSGVSFNLDINNPDCDGDGLLDGEEIVVKISESGNVYGKIKSNPWLANSDLDAYGDWDEVKIYNSNPMIKNVSFSNIDTTFLIENENFVSDKYMDFYENKWYGWLERASLWLGNNVFGTNYDTVYLYKTILMEYLEQMVEESEEANEIREIVGFTHKILNQANENIGKALEIASEGDKDYLRNLQQQMSTYTKNLDELANGDFISAGYTKEQIYKIWDDTFAEYQKVSEKVPALESKIEFNAKVGKASEVFGVVMDVADVVISGYDFYKDYNSFASKISGMEFCLDTLDEIIKSSNSPEQLKTAANELYKAIEEQKVNNLDTFFDGLIKVGGKISNIAVTAGLLKIPVVGKYLAAAKAVLGIGDFVFNIADVAEQCTCLYAIAKSSTIIASKFNSDLSKGSMFNNWRNIYDGYAIAASDYFSLAIMRKTSELQMKKADEANSFLIEWLFSEFMYKVDDINSNVNKIDEIKYKYVVDGAQ